MHTPGPTAGNTATGAGVARRRSSGRHRMALHVAPAAGLALYGALWITPHAGGGRGSAHTFFQSLALAETVVALLLYGRKPAAALAGVLAVYLVFALDPLLLPAVLFALLTVAMERDRRTAVIAAAAAAAATATWPYIGGRAVSFAGHTLPRLAAFGMAVAAATYLRQRRNRRAVDPGQPPACPSVADVSVRTPDL